MNDLELTPKQKVKVFDLYVEYLKLKQELGMDVRRDEVVLLYAGAEEIQADLNSILETVLPALHAFIQNLSGSILSTPTGRDEDTRDDR